MLNFPSVEDLYERMVNTPDEMVKYFLKLPFYEGLPWTTYMLSRSAQFNDHIPYSNIQILSNELLTKIGSGVEKSGHIFLGLSLINLALPRIYGLSKVRHGLEKIGGALVTYGIYDFIRHPMYLGGRLMSLGYFLQKPSIGSALGCLAVYLTTEMAARGEEKILEIEWGEKAKEYKERVPRWMPRISDIPKNFKEMKNRLKLLKKKDLDSFLNQVEKSEG